MLAVWRWAQGKRCSQPEGPGTLFDIHATSVSVVVASARFVFEDRVSGFAFVAVGGCTPVKDFLPVH